MVDKTCLIVCGSESSGNNVLCKRLRHDTGWSVFGRSWHTLREADVSTGDAAGFVFFRSLPFFDEQAREFDWEHPTDLAEMAAYEGMRPILFLTTRDLNAIRRSKINRGDRESESLVDADIERARRMIAEALRSPWPSTVWSYESHVALGAAYAGSVYRSLGLTWAATARDMKKLRDENAKYLSG